MHWFDLNDRNVDDIRDAKGADSQPLPWFLFFFFKLEILLKKRLKPGLICDVCTCVCVPRFMQRPATDDEESVKVATASSDWLVSDQEEELIRLLVADSDHTVEH